MNLFSDKIRRKNIVVITPIWFNVNMLDQEYVVEVAKLLIEFYEEYGEKNFNGCISIALKYIGEKTKEEYSYGTYSFSYVEGRKPNSYELDLHRKHNNEKYGDYQIHDILNRYRRDALTPDWMIPETGEENK